MSDKAKKADFITVQLCNEEVDRLRHENQALRAENSVFRESLSRRGKSIFPEVMQLHAELAAAQAALATEKHLRASAQQETQRAFRREELAKAELAKREARGNPRGCARWEGGQHCWDLLRKQLASAQAALREAQKDAERYRWLRDVGDSTWKPMRERGITAAECDAAIDAAKGE